MTSDSGAGFRRGTAGVVSWGMNGLGVIAGDPVRGFRQETGLVVDWSSEEQTILKAGLVKYADEPNIMKYIKIAAMLRDKTVRDVALRCRWMTKKESGKRRKPEEYYTGKKIKDRKEKIVDSPFKASMHLFSPGNMATHPFMMHHLDHHSRLSYEVPAVDSATQHLLDENTQVLIQITANLATFKLLDNVDLLYRTRNNITTILNSMSEMPGIMSMMPPLPVSVNENLINTILPSVIQAPTFRTLGGIHLKQEPRC